MHLYKDILLHLETFQKNNFIRNVQTLMSLRLRMLSGVYSGFALEEAQLMKMTLSG